MTYYIGYNMPKKSIKKIQKKTNKKRTTRKRAKKMKGAGCGPSKMDPCPPNRQRIEEKKKDEQEKYEDDYDEDDYYDEDEYYDDKPVMDPHPEPEPVDPSMLTLKQLEDLKKELIPVRGKKKIGKHYYFDNPNNGNGLRYTMETGIYQGEEDFREPSFRDIKLLYKAPLDKKCDECRSGNRLGLEGCTCGRLRGEGNFYDWTPYHDDPGVRETANFYFYVIDPKFTRKATSRFLTEGKIHGKETNALLASKIGSFLNN